MCLVSVPGHRVFPEHGQQGPGVGQAAAGSSEPNNRILGLEGEERGEHVPLGAGVHHQPRRVLLRLRLQRRL